MLDRAGQKRDIFFLHLLEMEALASNLVHYQDERSAAVQGLQYLSLWYYCQSVFHPLSLLHAASFCHTAKIDGKCIKGGHPLPYESSLSYTLREEETERCSRGIPLTVGKIYSSSKEGQEGCWSKKMQVKSVRHKTQHSIHSRQTPPQCQRGKRSVLYCTSNCSSVMEMHV